MSDLQCAATFLVTRHGDATYPVPGVLTDAGGWLTGKGQQQATDLGQSLYSARIAAVYTSTLNRAVETGRLIAAELGVTPVAVPGLQEYSVGDLAGASFNDPRAQAIFDAWAQGDLSVGFPEAENGEQVLRRYEDSLAHLADLHRGENVVVVSHGGVMSLALPRLDPSTPAEVLHRRFLPNCVPAELRRDGDGWRLEEWPGSADRHVV